MKEPVWKTVLNWGTVLIFLAFPIVLFITQLWVYPTLDQEKVHLDYLREFMRNITILIFGLAGLRTWETIRENGRKPPQQLKNVHAEQKVQQQPKSLEAKLKKNEPTT